MIQKILRMSKKQEQWKCKNWYKQKTGLITSSIAHRTLTMQTSIDKGLEKGSIKTCGNYGIPEMPF
jgi:hypothetical protein